MRAAFADEIEKLAAEDSRIVLLSGDIGNRMFDTFKEKFDLPAGFINIRNGLGRKLKIVR